MEVFIPKTGSLYIQGGPIDLHSDTYISGFSGTFTHLDVGSYLDIDVIKVILHLMDKELYQFLHQVV